jgi:voltage-gated potassium channel
VEAWRRLRFGVAAFIGVLVAGTVGYLALGFPLLDAAYQTVTTVATVGHREVRPLSDVGRVFTMVLILVGVATALYTFTLVLEAVVEVRLHHQPAAGDRALHRPDPHRHRHRGPAEGPRRRRPALGNCHLTGK